MYTRRCSYENVSMVILDNMSIYMYVRRCKKEMCTLA